MHLNPPLSRYTSQQMYPLWLCSSWNRHNMHISKHDCCYHNSLYVCDLYHLWLLSCTVPHSHCHPLYLHSTNYRCTIHDRDRYRHHSSNLYEVSPCSPELWKCSILHTAKDLWLKSAMCDHCRMHISGTRDRMFCYNNLYGFSG